MHNQHVCHAQSSASNSNPHPTPAHTHTKLANANRCCISNVNFLCISCLPKILLRQKLTHPPRRFSQGTRNLRTNCPRLSTKMCTVAGWPCLTQSTARAPATANMDTTLPHVMPTGKNRHQWIMFNYSISVLPQFKLIWILFICSHRKSNCHLYPTINIPSHTKQHPSLSSLIFCDLTGSTEGSWCTL